VAAPARPPAAAASQRCPSFSAAGRRITRVTADSIVTCPQHEAIIRRWVRGHFSSRGVPGSFGPGVAPGMWFCAFDPGQRRGRRRRGRAQCTAGKNGFVRFTVR